MPLTSHGLKCISHVGQLQCLRTWLPWWFSDEESACNAGDLGFIPGLGRSPGEGKWPGEFHGLYSPWGRKELDTTERLSLFTFQMSGLMWLFKCLLNEDMKKREIFHLNS